MRAENRPECTIVHFVLASVGRRWQSHQHMNDRADGLGEAVRSRRESLGLRQVELADLAGCSTRFVHMLEQDKATVRMDKVLDVLGALGLTLELVRGHGGIRVPPELQRPEPR